MKPFTLLFASLICATSLLAQIRPPEIVWQKSFGGTKEDIPRAMLKTPDGGYILGGSTTSREGDISGHHDNYTPEPWPPGFQVYPDAWLIKIDGTGNKVWQKCVGGNLPDDLYSLIPATDGGYIAFGETVSNNNGSDFSSSGASDIFIFKFDESGNIIWKKTIGGTGYERGGNIRATADGGYIVASSTNTPTMPGFHWNHSNPNNADIWVFKIDKDGNMLWQKCIGNFFDQVSIDIMQMQNGGYALTAGYSTADMETRKAIRFTLDATGNTVDSTFYLNPGPNLTYEMGGLFKIGTTDTIAHALKYQQKNIATCFNRTIGGIKFGNTLLESLICMPDNNTYNLRLPTQIQSYGNNLNIVVGQTTDTASVLQNHGGDDAYFAIFDTHGTVYTRKSFGGSGGDEFVAVVQINNDEFMALGRSSSNDQQVSSNHGITDFWVVKLRIPPASNTVKGFVFYDKNSNGVKDINENYYEDALVKSIKSSSISFSSISTNGAYQNAIDTGTYTTSVLINQQYHTVVPVSMQSIFSTYNNTDSFDFAVQPIPNKKDLEISLIPLSAVRPGFESSYKIVYKNVGTEPLTTSILLVKDHRQTFLSALPAQNAMSNDSITWNLGTLQPYDAGSITIKLKQVIPPSLQNGDTLILNAEVSPVAGDETALNNKTLLRQRVTGSFDPNDKSEKNGGFILPQQVSDKEDLEYTIRFQNTGTDTAFNARVLDTLDDKLDLNSIRLVTASHPFTISISNDKYLTWAFNDILLPDSNVNEALSHGYITYRIKAKASVVTGDIIHNSASIYFDFNTPVRTNIQETVVKPLPVAAPPQPFVSGILNSYCSSQGIQKGKIENLPASTSGIIVTVRLDVTTLTVAADSTFSFDVAALSAGIHTIQVVYSNGGGSKTTNQNFENTTAIMPDVNVSASVTNILNLTDPVIVTAINANGGGAGPLYTFGKNRDFTAVWQPESASSTLTITPSLLAVGDNWVYVRMKSNAGCVTFNTAADSIKLVRDMMTGITDPDNPASVISLYPNPFNKQVYISGLSAGKSYTISISSLNGQLIQQNRISNRTNAELVLQTSKAGIYLLSIYDEKKKQFLGSIKLIKQ